MSSIRKTSQKISACLWFDDQAEDAAKFYTGIFRNSKIVKIARYGKVGQEIHGRKAGSVMTVDFELDGQRSSHSMAGRSSSSPRQSRFTSSVTPSRSWTTTGTSSPTAARLSAACGWLKDKFGVSWQVVPTVLQELVSDPDSAKSQRAFEAMLQMKKLDIAGLQRAYAG